MKHTTPVAFAVICCFFLAVKPGRAQQANNTQPLAVSPPQSSGPADPALALPVDIAANGQTLAELLQGLNDKSKPQLQAQEPTAWQHVIVYTHQQPLDKAMGGLKTLLNCDWVRNSSDPAHIRYVLKAMGRSEQYDRELYRLTLERGAEPMLRLTEYLKTPVEEYARQNDKYWKDHIESKDRLLNENLFGLSRPGGRNGLEFLTTLTPEQRFTLLSEGTYFVSMNAMTEQQRRLTHNMGLETGRIKQKWGDLSDGETQEASAKVGDQFGVMLQASVHPVTGAFLGFGISIGNGGGGGGGTKDMPPPTPLLAVRGNPYHFSPGSKPKLPVYPDLQKMPLPTEFKLEKGRQYAWREILTELTKYVSLPIYSDDFGFVTVAQDRLYGGEYSDIDTKKYPLGARPKLTKLMLTEGLDALCNQYGYLWWHQNGALFFRSRTWFIEHLYEVPPPVLAFVRHQIETEGKLDAKGLMALSGLTKKQLVALSITNLTYGPTEVGRRVEVGGYSYDKGAREEQRADSELAWEFLQVYGVLNEEQKNRALTSEGASFAEMNPEAQRKVFYALYTRQSVMRLTKPEKVRLVVYQRINPPAHPDGPRQADIGFSFLGATLSVRVMPLVPKASELPSDTTRKARTN